MLNRVALKRDNCNSMSELAYRDFLFAIFIIKTPWRQNPEHTLGALNTPTRCYFTSLPPLLFFLNYAPGLVIIELNLNDQAMRLGFPPHIHSCSLRTFCVNVV